MAVVVAEEASELNVALPLRRERRRIIGLVTETDLARAFIRLGGATMAKGIQFNHPGGDVVAFRIEIDSLSKSEIVPIAQFARPGPDPTLYQLDMSKRPVWAGIDGLYDVDVIAIDDAGNESGENRVAAVSFDFLAPVAVTNLRGWP